MGLGLPPVIGHRGAAGHAPENTLVSFRTAARLGVAWVEFDAMLTKDGVPVVFHDNRLDRTTDGFGLLRNTPLDRLKRLDAGGWAGPAFAGERVPTLAEALAEIAALGMGINIEIKPTRGRDAETARRVLAVAGEVWPSGMPPPLVSSFSRAAVAVAGEVRPDWPRGLLFGAPARDWRGAASDLGCVSINVHHRRVGQAQVAAMREAGFDVLAYTVNDPARARLLWGWGVTSVFSDVPDRL